ncbi:MAG: hypothetical protein PUK72_07490 [Oscillospiraceae bacterium]|nr:hypothetical protein [Oscillospiraceae bacterium]
MKKKKIIAIIAASVVAIYLVCVNAWNMSLKANFSREDGYKTVFYNDRVYKQNDVSDYEIYKDYDMVEYPKTYIRSGNIRKYYRFAGSYFVPLVSSTIDKTESFIVVDPDDSSLNMTYVADDFVFPELNEDTVEGVYKFYTPSAKIGDIGITTEFIKAALSGEEIDIDNEIWEKMGDFYDKENLKSFYFRFKDCPLYSEEYVAEKTESGKYKIYKPGPWYMYTQ